MEAENYKKNVFIWKMRVSSFGGCFRSQNGAKFVTKYRFGNQKGANLVTKPAQNHQTYGSQSEKISKTAPKMHPRPFQDASRTHFGWILDDNGSKLKQNLQVY